MGAVKLPTPAKKNIRSIADLEKELLNQRSTLDRVSDSITRFMGSLPFVLLHLVWFSVWIILNLSLISGEKTFDPFPYVFLNLVLAIEAVFLSTFVLISQNREARHADQWAHLDLQIGMLAEQENTQVLKMLQAICNRLGLADAAQDKELKDLLEKTRVEELAEHLEKARDIDEGTASRRAEGSSAGNA
jgi:uncharacterized membrane protein